jgi:hypothetical protein
LASAFGYWLVLVLQLTAISLAWARGAWLSLLVAAVVVGAATIGLTGRRRRLVAALAAGAVMTTAILGGALVRARYGTFIPGETVQVRVLIWQQVTELLRARPERMPLGYGPEMLHAVVAPFYSPRLTAIEGQFSVPDRAHNDLLDAAVNAGLLGVAAVIALHLLFWAQLLPRVQTSRAGSTRWRDAAAALAGGASAGAIALVSQHAEWLAVATAAGIVAGLVASLTWGSLRSAGAGWSPARCLAAGVLASGLAHFTEIQFGIATISSRLVWWSCLGIATAWARGAHLSRVEAEPQPPAAAVPLAAAVMIAALAFAFWQPRAGLSVPAMFVLASTGAVAALLEWNNGQPAARRRMAAAWAAAAGVVAAMIAGLATWDAAVPAGGVVDAANWASHQATASLVFFLVAGSAVALAFRPDRPALFGWRPVVGFLAVGAVAILVVDSSARRARADLLAQIAGSLSGAGRRVEAGIVGAQRVRLTPESDRAWSALGSIELEMARRPEAPDRGVHFARASAALGEARRRNPFDWFHVRNQASAERVWAAADREGRAEHLAAADRLFGEAAILAPAFPRLWAEWGNVAAEKGDLRDAFVKLERAATLGGVRDAKTVADAILGATGFDIRDRAGRIRAAADLRRQGFTSLAALYADY